ncbi:hypothetical protein ACE5IS_00150 [Leptospira wolffii]|uniref:DUF695 domain-containing protein n=1 Tax=Leptospira wolffii TaxID=409998 RepID=A0A2M9ZFJ2_9LEPT|nr:hypothetical protein [Leptospira wolffii]EPG65250.1 hypothetical protein LEP1GSC061_3225 [Leptospira wolffii serovar Khorat str. Khorat-H2]PJZ67209.1 hypothetical protein CH371_03885 [Leptospira wolffii]TGL49009.1 hypothetical protein EHQ61_11020 [Leptospira wolffii]
MEEKAEKFWSWFSQNSKYYTKLDDMEDRERDRILDDLMDRLQDVNSEFYFEIGGGEGGPQELTVITAGDEDLYAEAERFVDLAPEIPGWEVFSVDQYQEKGTVIFYEGLELDSEEIWFLPLENSGPNNGFGVRICFPDYPNVESNPHVKKAVGLMLEAVLGEETFAQEIGYYEIGILPDDPEEEGYIELVELPDYIQWRKEREA